MDGRLTRIRLLTCLHAEEEEATIAGLPPNQPTKNGCVRARSVRLLLFARPRQGKSSRQGGALGESQYVERTDVDGWWRCMDQ